MSHAENRSKNEKVNRKRFCFPPPLPKVLDPPLSVYYAILQVQPSMEELTKAEGTPKDATIRGSYTDVKVGKYAYESGCDTCTLLQAFMDGEK